MGRVRLITGGRSIPPSHAIRRRRSYRRRDPDQLPNSVVPALDVALETRRDLIREQRSRERQERPKKAATRKTKLQPVPDRPHFAVRRAGPDRRDLNGRSISGTPLRLLGYRPSGSAETAEKREQIVYRALRCDLRDELTPREYNESRASMWSTAKSSRRFAAVLDALLRGASHAACRGHVRAMQCQLTDALQLVQGNPSAAVDAKLSRELRRYGLSKEIAPALCDFAQKA